jgi:hypothetical protein
MFGVSNSAIANHLGISRQAVTKHRKRGMPCESVEAASAWYFANVSTTRKKRGTFSTLPVRLPSYDMSGSDALDYLDRVNSGEDEADFTPAPVRLDNYPEGFWGEGATKSILRILGNEKTAPFKKRENVIAAWLCINAAMRLHLKLMPSIMSERIAGLRDRDAIQAELMEWVCTFAAHWYGPHFEGDPILPESIDKLSDFYRPLEGKE